MTHLIPKGDDCMKSLTDGQIIWEPTKEQIEQTVLTQYVKWLKEKKGLTFYDYHELWKWLE